MKETLTISRRSFLKAAGAAAALGSGAWLFRPIELFAQVGDKGEPLPPRAGEWKHTTCWIGKQDCGMLARVENGRIIKFEGNPDHPRNKGSLCPKGTAQIMAIYDPYRMKKPLKRKNAKGISGEWEEISWEDALNEVAGRIKDAIDRDPKLFLWQKGRSKAKDFYDDAFVKATGAEKMGHGGYCSDAGYRACEYTTGIHGVLHPDFRRTNYLLSWGWNSQNAGGNKFCWITWPRELLDAKQRGLKVVSVDPWKGAMGPQADRWLPIKPGTDLSFFLAIASVLIEKDYIDKEYLKKYTNSSFLVQESDGRFYRIDDKEQVWDTKSGASAAADAEGIDPELDGEHTISGVKVKTAYRLLKGHVATTTPEWAAGICGLSADSIRQVAEEFGEHAMIGATVVIDGVTVPLRPAAIMGYHVTQQELGFQACRMAVIVAMLVGSVESAGGTRTELTYKDYKNYSKLDAIEIKDEPSSIYLTNSKFYPINSALPGTAALVMLNPEKYGFPPEKIPEVCLIHMANPMVSFLDTPTLKKAYKKFKFVAVIDPWLSETADYFADIVLPAATIEKYEGVISANSQYEDAKTLRLPPIDPLFESRGEIDIYMDLCEKLGVLDKYLETVNKELKLTDTPNAIPTNAKPSVREIFDRWAKEYVDDDGIAFFEKNGIQQKGEYKASKIYGHAQNPPFKASDSANTKAGYTWIRHRLYGESLLRYREEMKAKGAGKIYYQDYTAFPIWRTPTMESSPSEYDLTLITYKRVEFKQSRSSFIPLLAEMVPEQLVDVNPAIARPRGIGDGDMVWVESHNAVTGETRRVKVKARYVEGIRPDTVGMYNSFGLWAHPRSKGMGPTPNELFFTGEGYVTNTNDQSYHVKVRVTKA